MGPEFSIIIPHYGSGDLLRSCLAAIKATAEEGAYELVIVDNGTGAPDLPGTVIRNAENIGFARACNQGAAAAKTGRLFFLNNDTRPLAGWTSPLIEALNDARIGAVGCKLVYPGGGIQHAGTTIVEDSKGRLRGLNETEDLPRRFVPAVSAAAMLVQRHAFEQVNGFDDGYWNSHEDVDFCLKLGDAGWKVLYEPAAVIEHIESASGVERSRGVGAARARFNERWSGRVQPSRRLPPRPKKSWTRRVARVIARTGLRRP